MMHDIRTTLLVFNDTNRAERLSKQLNLCGLKVTRTAALSDNESAAPHAILVHLPGHQAGAVAESVARLHQTYPESNIVVVTQSQTRETIRAAFQNGAWDVLNHDAPDVELSNVLLGAANAAPRTPRRRPGIQNVPLILRSTLVHPEDKISQPIDRDVDKPDGHSHGIKTHRAFLETLAIMRDARQRTDRTIALVQFDLDRFHECNERGSPAYGDQVLDWFNGLIKGAGRTDYITVRFQADQFVTILPDVDETEAIRFAEHCRQLMLDQQFTPGGHRIDLTATAGIVVSSPGCDETPHQLLQRGRVVLTYGKQQGGNRVVTWSQVMNDPLSEALRRPTSVYQASHWIARLRQHLRCMHMESTRALVAAIDARDPYTRTHSQTVASYAEMLARRMDFSGARLDALRAAALLHDVGKIGVPDAILTKPGPLTAEEFMAVKRHPETALDILRNVSFLSDVQPMILHHHERFDGRGYPFQLRGDQIPIGARIIAVADALDTMLSPRTYKDVYSIDRVRSELTAGKGSQFDPDVTALTLRLMDQEPHRFTTTSP